MMPALVLLEAFELAIGCGRKAPAQAKLGLGTLVSLAWASPPLISRHSGKDGDIEVRVD
jgi:hypothetical protein